MPDVASETDRVVLVFVTGPDRRELEQLGARLVEEELAACVNVLPEVTSIYRWEGKLERDSESMCIAKTTSDAVSRLEARVRELHPYELPEVLALAVTGGSRLYTDWVVDSVASRSRNGST